MRQETFKRYEKKYILTEEQYACLMLVLGGMFQQDLYGRHKVCNVYFDTPDYRLIRSSIEKPVYKEKLRLRGYAETVGPDSTVYVELKKKFDSVVYKRRMEMRFEDARKYLYYGIAPKEQGQVFNELDYVIRRYGLRAMAYISYEREAYTCQLDSEIRATFDREIMGRSGELDLQVEPYGKAILDEGEILMELTLPGVMPLWLGRILGELKIYPTSYSKYGTYYTRYVQPQREWGIEGLRESFAQRGQEWMIGGLACA